MSLSQALKLTATEERHLFLLASGEWPEKRIAEAEHVTPALRKVIDALNPHPAFLVGRCWDALVWNQAAELLFRFQEPCPPHSQNIVWRFFCSETRTFHQEWEQQAQSLVAQFRADYARYPGDVSFRKIIEDLQQASPQFCQWWEQQNVRSVPDGPRVIQHPTLGRLEFEHVTFQPSLSHDLRVKIYTASEVSVSVLEQALSCIQET